METGKYKYDVFISYSRIDTAIADKICSAFDKAGITYFIDRQGIGGAYEFPAVLAHAILESEIFLYLASENSYKSKFTNSEITFAFNEKPRNRILPYIIDGSNLPVEQRFIFSAINWRNLQTHPIDTVLVSDMLQLLGRDPKEVMSKQKSASQSTVTSQTGGRGDAVAANKKGDEYYSAKNYAEAVKWYRKAAEQGYAIAQNNLGDMYYFGKGVDKDYSEAVKWYRKAAEQGNASGQSNLGYMYSNGYGVNEDKEEAVKWYRKAAEQGNASAQANLGLMYERGKGGLDKDYNEAVKWYRKAAEQGNANGQYNLGDMYEYGKGVDQDKAEAVKWYRKAAEKGHQKAQKALERLKA